MNITLNYETFGDGKPVIMLHGLFGSARNLRGLSKKLAENHQVFSLDLRNHGESGHHASMTYAEMAADLARFIEELNTGPVSIVGHSMGGKAAMAFCLENNCEIERLVIMDIAPVQYWNNFRAIVNALLSLQLESVTSRKQAHELLADAIPDNNMRLFLLQNLLKGPDGFYWRINLQSISDSLTDIGAFPDFPDETAYRGPTLFLNGAQSDYILPEHHAQIRDLFPEATFQNIADAGHWLHADQPDRVSEAILHFLSV